MDRNNERYVTNVYNNSVILSLISNLFQINYVEKGNVSQDES